MNEEYARYRRLARAALGLGDFAPAERRLLTAVLGLALAGLVVLYLATLFMHGE